MKFKTWLKNNYKDIIIDAIILFFVGFLVAVGGLFLWVSTLEIPDLSAFEQRRVLQSTKIYDRTGEILLYDLHEDVRRTIVPFEDISYYIKNATIAIEDDQFYNHGGISIRGILRAAFSNLFEGDLLGGQGGSTITQQVIKNSILEQEKKLTRKVKEAILSIKIEKILTKDEILSFYLNESPYGGTIYGVEEASQAFFGKSAKDVTLAEAAYIAALPQAPTYLSPYGNNRDALEARKQRVLDRMLDLGFINQDEHKEASETEVEFQSQVISGIRAPHFVMYIRDLLTEKYGEEALAEKGYRVITTLNYDLQKEAERIVKEKAPGNKEKFNASNVGLVAVDPQTGDILTMVGSRDYFDEEIDGNFNVALAKRQPGSSIKPYVYASAFSKGYRPETVVFDVKTQFSTACEPWDMSNSNPCYSPNNYNSKFVGPIQLRNALAQSLNIPAVKVLYLTGLKDAIKLATDMGLTTLNDPDRLGLTLVLGGGEVTLLEHTGGYGVFANEGVKAERRAILRIEDVNGNVLEEPEVKSERVLDRDVALLISDILSDNNARAPLWGYNSQVNFTTRDVAAKSGSTNNSRDAWIMGYTPNLAVGVWVGNNDNAPMNGLSGLIATPTWREFFDIALETVEDKKFPEPPPLDSSLKPILRGEIMDPAYLLSQVQLGNTTLDIAGIASGIHTILHFVDRTNPTGPYPTNPERDGQYANWEYGVNKWKEEAYGTIINAVASSTKPNDDDDDAEED
ncbi:penicillin-binding protein [Candidatus Kaiserbacteria bacterium]|nr:penicillin-binding protein [Candidatus Kaiserbacteria bacterium]